MPGTKLADLATAMAPLPSCVPIEPVGRGRPRGSTPAPALMSFETYCRLVGEVPALGEIELRGPVDPLLHPRFFDMVRYAAQRGLEVRARSELFAVSERLAEQCVTSGLARLQVVLPPPRTRAPEEIEVGLPFIRGLRNLARIVAARRRLASQRPVIEIVDVVTRGRLPQLPELVRLAHKHGAASLQMLDPAESLAGEDPQVVARWFGEARALASALGVDLRFP